MLKLITICNNYNLYFSNISRYLYCEGHIFHNTDFVSKMIHVNKEKKNSLDSMKTSLKNTIRKNLRQMDTINITKASITQQLLTDLGRPVEMIIQVVYKTR